MPNSDLAQPQGAPNAHLFSSGGRLYLFHSGSVSVFTWPSALEEPLRAALDFGDAERVEWMMRGAGVQPDKRAPTARSTDVRALSLAISKKCNLGCTYCYADGGEFGSPGRGMSSAVAKQSVDRLLGEAEAGDTVHLSFLGGEPLANRAVLREVTEYAAAEARDQDVEVGFSVTTNGTLITEDDASFFAEHDFAVTVSIDGVGHEHDALRPLGSGVGSLGRVLSGVDRLLTGGLKLTARVTVTPRNLDLPRTLESLLELGFREVTFSPMLRSPSGDAQMDEADLEAMLQQMIACAERFENCFLEGRVMGFTNVLTNLRAIHQGQGTSFSCGAGGRYLGVSATGEFYACHRFVDEDSARLGGLDEGPDREAQARWLAPRAVDQQKPCRSCWARYLCGGGCHYESGRRGGASCDYIRGWIDHCLGLYVRLSQKQPAMLHALVS